MKKVISSDYFLFAQKALQCDSCDSCDVSGSAFIPCIIQKKAVTAD